MRDFEGTRIGDVVDVAVDLSASYAPYLIVSRNGERIPVPISLFRFSHEFRLSSEESAKPSFYLDVQDIARLEAAPTLSEINPTDAITDVIWDDRVHSYWAYSGVQAPPVAFTGGYRRYRFVGAGGGMPVLLAAVATTGRIRLAGGEALLRLAPGPPFRPGTSFVSLGRIEEYLITRDGAVPYGILAPYAETGGPGEHIPVPIPAFTIDR